MIDFNVVLLDLENSDIAQSVLKEPKKNIHFYLVLTKLIYCLIIGKSNQRHDKSHTKVITSPKSTQKNRNMKNALM